MPTVAASRSEDEYAMDDETAEADAREATVWIEGLDRINKALGGRGNGIRLCVDLSATPFYIQGSGNEVGKPFPWVVSDFSLLEAIEAGLVKIPQLPTRGRGDGDTPPTSTSGGGCRSGHRTDGTSGPVTLDEVMRYATAPITQLAASWRETLGRVEEAVRGGQPAVTTCRRCSSSCAATPRSPRNCTPGSPTAISRTGRRAGVPQRSRAGDDGPDRQQGRRGHRGGRRRTTRRGGCASCCRRSARPSGRATRCPRSTPRWSRSTTARRWRTTRADSVTIDPDVPPGRDVRCIISVAMLSEGWDATTVTHVVGLRPFGSQLLCEQVVGRALRRTSYAVDPDTKLFTEETAQIFGVPFELIPFKVEGGKPQPPTPPANHVYAEPDQGRVRDRVPGGGGVPGPGDRADHGGLGSRRRAAARPDAGPGRACCCKG